MEKHKTIFEWKALIFEHAWVVELMIVLAVLLMLNFLMKNALLRVKRKAHLRENDWRTHLDFAALFPARVLFWQYHS